MSAVIALTVVSFGVSAFLAYTSFNRKLDPIDTCRPLGGTSALASDQPGFGDCYTAYSKSVKAEYEQGKDVAKEFLTLLSGMLLLSITFSDKIVHWETAGEAPKRFLYLCWLLLVGAIGCCGTGLALMTYAYSFASGAPVVIGTPQWNIWPSLVDVKPLFGLGGRWGATAGILFGVAVFCLMLAGLTATRSRSDRALDGRP